MAEGLWAKLGHGFWEAYSAGSNPAGYVHPLAVRVMEEEDVDLSTHHSKHANQFAAQAFDLVVTVCDSAKETCPVFPGAKETLHWPFPDPADAQGTEDEQLVIFRSVRDQIQARILSYLASRSS